MTLTKLALATLAVLATGSASAQSISTGVAPWLVNGNPGVIESPLATPFWINNFGDASWIGTALQDGNLSGGAAAGTYVFSMNIGAYAGTGLFALNYAADNSVVWSITNGSLSGTTSCAVEDCFSASGGAPRAMAGSFAANSVLTATVTNMAPGATPMGLLVQGVAVAAVPEPATWALWAVGALGLMAVRRKAA